MRPSLLGVVPSWSIVSTTIVVAAVMAAIPMVTVEVGLEVTLAIPPPTAVEERRETELPASSGGGAHGSPSWSELEGLGGDMARPEVEHPLISHGVQIVEVPCSSEAGTGVEPPAIPPS